MLSFNGWLDLTIGVRATAGKLVGWVTMPLWDSTPRFNLTGLNPKIRTTQPRMNNRIIQSGE